MPLSTKQEMTIRECTAPYNFWGGAIASGKTFASVLALRDFLRYGPPGTAMILGASRDSIQRNVLSELYRLLGSSPPPSKTNRTYIYGREVYFIGAHDEGAMRVIKGANLVLAYVDEVDVMPYAVFKMLEGRLRLPGSRLYATFNPQGPAHWLKKEYIDVAEERGFNYWKFLMEDNPSLDEGFKLRVKTSYTGMWYKRLVLGEWAASNGLVFDAFDEDNIFENPSHNPNFYIAGVDYGTSSVTAAVLCAVSPTQRPQIRVDKEYYYNAKKEDRSKTDAEYADDLREFCEHYNLKAMYVDPSAASLKIELLRRNIPVVDANNDVLLGVKITSKFIAQKELMVHKGCKNLIEHLQSYTWDAKASDRGEDKPDKKSGYDHLADALRYACCSAFPRGEFYAPDEHLSIDEIRRQVYGDRENILDRF